MKVLSLFDGMACGMLAMIQENISVSKYIAYEIDKYAIKTSTHNFPMIEHKGDVFKADFTEHEDFDFLVGGSPCTYWSIAQKNNRETEASGLGWELFSQYVRALHEAKPKYFIYENNKSMSKAIRESISSTFGFEPICINSALVSAQNRQRLYWCGIRQPDGTYKKADIPQPEDRGILLKDILEGADRLPAYGNDEKSRPVTFSYAQQGPGQIEKNCFPENPNKQKYDYIAEQVRIPAYGIEDKSRPINALYPNNCGGFEHRMFSDNPSKQQVDMIAEPVVPFVVNKFDKAVEKYGYIPEMYNPYNNAEITDKAPTQTAQCGSQTKSSTGMIVEPIRVGAMPKPNGELATSQSARVYDISAKSVTLNAGGGGLGAKTGLYAILVEFGNGVPAKAISCADGKTYDVYEVKDGLITIKGKQYPIKLTDGYYIIRKLTVKECMRLQTVPEWYEFPVSNSQAYKMLGNGWTVDVIAHLVKHTVAECIEEEFEQLTL